jgi:hypothetical protein
LTDVWIQPKMVLGLQTDWRQKSKNSPPNNQHRTSRIIVVVRPAVITTLPGRARAAIISSNGKQALGKRKTIVRSAWLFMLSVLLSHRVIVVIGFRFSWYLVSKRETTGRRRDTRRQATKYTSTKGGGIYEEVVHRLIYRIC